MKDQDRNEFDPTQEINETDMTADPTASHAPATTPYRADDSRPETVPVSESTTDHPPERKPAHESEPDEYTVDEAAAEAVKEAVKEAMKEAAAEAATEAVREAVKQALKQAVREATERAADEGEAGFSLEDINLAPEEVAETAAYLFVAPAEASDPDDGQPITEETVEEAIEDAIEDVTADIEEEEEILAEQRPQEMERRFEDLEALLDSRHYADFRRALEDLNPVDAAEFFDELPPKRIPAVFKLLDKDTAADVFAELEIETQERIISAMTDREISQIVEELALDDTTEMLKELPANMVRRIMKNATPETRTDINRLLAYPEDSAGSVMTSEFIDLHRDMTCAEAVAHIRATGVDKETVYVAYVTDASRVLQGIVPLKSLLFASADERIEDIMDEDVICASTMDDQETVASTVSKYDLLAIPIVDREYRLVGIVTVDDAMDVMETEATEDIEKMAAISPTDKPYLKTGVFETWRKRVPWLLLLMLSATFTSTILARYESILDAATISLAVFVPMLTGTGGNASSQTSVTVIRGLSLGEIEMRDILRVLWKEIRVACVCGLTVATACFAKTMLVDLRLDFSPDSLLIAAIVSATMFCAVLFAKIMGVLLPIGAKRIGVDPAVMASPFITTVVDTLTLLIYVVIASALLPI